LRDWSAYQSASSSPVSPELDKHFGQMSTGDQKKLRVMKCFAELTGYNEDDWGDRRRLYYYGSERKFMEYFRQNPRFLGALRKSDFGKLTFAGFEFSGTDKGKWFSVDQNGRVRSHGFVNAGSYKSARTSRKSSFRSSGRS